MFVSMGEGVDREGGGDKTYLCGTFDVLGVTADEGGLLLLLVGGHGCDVGWILDFGFWVGKFWKIWLLFRRRRLVVLVLDMYIDVCSEKRAMDIRLHMPTMMLVMMSC